MSNFSKRLRELESQLAVGSIVVVLADGQRLHIRKRDLLDVYVAACRRADARNEAQECPPSPFDGILDALEKSSPIASPEPLIEVATDALQATPALASDTPEDDAPIQPTTVN
jgi:hypothetical protein